MSDSQAAQGRDDWETECPAREDRLHCTHWYDATGPCCACGDNTGMEEAQAEMAVGKENS